MLSIDGEVIVMFFEFFYPAKAFPIHKCTSCNNGVEIKTCFVTLHGSVCYNGAVILTSKVTIY